MARTGLAAFVCIVIIGGSVMATEVTPSDPLADLKKQTEFLTEQINLLNAQIALNTAKQTQDAALAKALAEALASQVTAHYNLESEQAKLSFAELAGIKTALGNVPALPTGKSGTVLISANKPETALLRSKEPMLRLLDEIATELSKEIQNDAVIVTPEQLEKAYQAEFTRGRIKNQTENLKSATTALEAEFVRWRKESTVVGQIKLFGGLPAATAAVYSLGFAMDTVNSLAKLFRVDRTINVSSADPEGLEVLSFLLQAKNPGKIVSPVTIHADILEKANDLRDELTKLLVAIQAGNDKLDELKKIEEEAKAKSSTHLPKPEIISELKAQLDGATSLLDALHPSKKPDAFWAQAKGQLLYDTAKERDRLMLEVHAQSLQVTESRWWRSDQLSSSGEVQVVYRLLDKTGTLKKVGVILKASGRQKSNLKKETTFVTHP